MKKLSIDVYFPQERHMNQFLNMLAWMELCGNVGHCTDFQVRLDGDGSARPKFKFNSEEMQKSFDDLRTDMGVRRLMEFLGNVVPFVSEMPKLHNTRGEEISPDTAGPTSIYFFKTGMEPHIGEVSYFKVMSGTLKAGADLQNADRGSKERIAQIYACAGANRIAVDEMHAGDIGCTVKLKDVKTGNTLNDKDTDNRFDFIKYPNPKYSRAVKAINEAETEKMMAALTKMRQEALSIVALLVFIVKC